MKSFIATAALSLLALSTIAEAQPQKEQSLVAAHLMATLPTQDVETIIPAFHSINVQSLLASLPMMDVAVEAPADRVTIAALMASLPTVDESSEAPASRLNTAKLLASLPIVDTDILTGVSVDTDINHPDSKYHPAAIRLTEE